MPERRKWINPYLRTQRGVTKRVKGHYKRARRARYDLGVRSTRTQSMLFKRDQWTASKAKLWLKSHGFKSTAPDITKTYIRFRQEDPRRFSRIRRIPFNEEKGIIALMGFVG